ncbi:MULTISPECIES: hypothetical protein [unclassified Streptomyces]|uniref:hypothetical protein n=1 Tax=unclassified Streptomyces TaxID=2593676 RepID=UPI0006AFBFBB|nr:MULTISPECIES: hypothetical protein [unclassified Streptomyces]KOX16571.1 hypothetical protein ADL06_33260 [Streptomyces sp. NRRL F-6491]KOX36101.1 hypothetical protein ADL08_33480 [Streptomyces sp. NRRL F-6492]
MVSLPEFLLRHRITVEAYEGDGAYGPVYGAPVPEVPALVAASVRMVRAPDGREVTSSAQIIAAPDLACPVGSRITLPDGRVTTALSVARHTAPGLPVPACSEVMCE